MADYVILKKQILDMGKSLGLEGNELTAFAAEEMEQARLREKEKEESADKIRAEEARIRAEEEERTARIRAEEEERTARSRAEEEERTARMRAEEEERAARIRAEEARIRAEEARFRAEEDERTERRLQLQLQLAQTQNENTNNNSNSSGNSSPASTGASLPDPVVTIPIEQFDENQDLEEYINRFENLMEFHQLPRSQWSIKLSLGLKNMAFNIYNHLPPTDKADYDTVKASLFRYYQVTADNYRKKFKAIKRDKHETYKQVSTRLKLCLSKWLSLSNLDATYEDLVELIVSDQLMSNMSNELRTFIKENGGKRLDEIVELSDRYILARETDNQPRQSQNNNRYRAQVTPPPPPNYYGQSNHKTGHKPNKVTPSHPFDRHQRQAPPTRRPYCNNCKTNTHETSQCRTIKRTNTLALTKTLPVKENTSIQITPPPHQPVVDDVKVNGKIVTGLYDTGLDFDAVVSEELISKEQYTTETLQLQCATYSQEPMKLPIAIIDIECPYVVGQIKAAVIPEPLYPIILGAKYVFLAVPKTPIHACPISTRAQKTAEAEANKQDNPESKQMKLAQESDPTLKRCFQKLPLAHTPPRRGDYVIKDELLYRQHNTDDIQLVVPSPYRQQVLDNGHSIAFSGHAGMGATNQRISAHFFWPGISDDIKRYVRSCPTCQRKNTRNNLVPVTLGEMPIIGTAFERCSLDIVGPLPLSRKKNRFILTLIDCCTMWTEAIALPRIDAKSIAEALISIFTRLGFPRQILTDNGSQLCGRLMKEVFQILHAQHITTSVYHPQSNGQVERFNGTLMSILKKIVDDKPENWDTYLAPALYAYREVPHTSTGIAPATLLFGRPIAGPLDALKAKWTNKQLDDTVTTASKYVQELKTRLSTGWTAAAEALKQARKKQAKYYNRRTKDRSFNIGDRVMLLLPQGHNKLEIAWQGPFVVMEKLSRTNYRIQMGKKLKTYHVNLLKKYFEREPVNQLMALAVAEGVESTESHASDFPTKACETYRDVTMDPSLSHKNKLEIENLIKKYESTFTDQPGCTTLLEVDFTLNDHTPIRSKPYPVPLSREAIVDQEIKTMLETGIISPSTSPYSSPIILLRKPSGEHRLCVDFRKVNTVINFQAEPLPNQERIFAKLHKARYFSKLDLSKGYYQIPVPTHLRQYLAFSTPKAQYHFNVLPFGLHIAPSIFSRMMTQLLSPLGNDDILHFMDDCLIASDTWEQHLNSIEELLGRLQETNLTARPTKCQLGFTELDFLGHHLKQGNSTPDPKNIEKLRAAPRPKTKKDVRSFLGMCGFYQKYIPRFNIIASPLSDLTRKTATDKVQWNPQCEIAFTTLKECLTSKPVLQLPNPDQPYTLRTDAAKTGIAACLMQSNPTKPSQLHPIAFASRKLTGAEQNYSTVEQECLAIVWAIHKFQLYLYGKHFTLQTDNQPMMFLASAQAQNAKLMRWAIILQQYTFHVEHIKGKDNHIADYLSRHVVDTSTPSL